MITVFTSPRAMNGLFSVIQSNAFNNWKSLCPGVEIMIFGNEEGIKEVCDKYGFLHIPFIPLNKEGLPYIKDLFRIANELARNNILMYSNADILFGKRFIEVIDFLKKQISFLAVGQRYDVDVCSTIVFDDDWERDLKTRAILHAPTAKDYFIFTKNYFTDSFFRDFVIARPGWDDFFVHHSIMKNKNIIDLSKVLDVFHQNHDRVINLKKPVDFSSKSNLKLLNRSRYMFISTTSKIPNFLSRLDNRFIFRRRLFWFFAGRLAKIFGF